MYIRKYSFASLAYTKPSSQPTWFKHFGSYKCVHTKFVVYLITCSICHLQYVGSTLCSSTPSRYLPYIYGIAGRYFPQIAIDVWHGNRASSEAVPTGDQLLVIAGFLL